MRLVVTGRHGQVARALALVAEGDPAVTVTAIGRPELDLGRPDTVAAALGAARPDVVVNAAAFTAVDRAEAEEDAAMQINRDGAAAVAGAARALGARLIHLSTDYVFSGDKAGPYVETDAVGPLGAYGRSKLAGEQAVRQANPGALILRTAWVFSPFGTNFVNTMLRIGRERPQVRVVDDQVGNPTSALDLAAAILRLTQLLEGDSGDTYHLCGEGDVTWCGFAREIFRASAEFGGPAPEVVAITTADYPTAARRPRNSRLDCSRFRSHFGFGLGPWQVATRDTVRRLLAQPA
jgi:dTDP-4-dehydrorhamnose reductase